MPQLATPRSAADAYRQSSPMPGHVFSLYLPMWNTEWERAGDDARRGALEAVCKAGIGRLPDMLLKRQRQLAEIASAETIEAEALSPFVTGMGEAHAVENGFAFLNPYGVPYLAGSGVKGVIRRAAEELAAGLNPDGAFGWTHARVMWLFGYEDDGKKDEESGIRKLLEKERKEGGASNEAQALLEKMQSPTFLNLEKGNSHFMGALSFWDVIINGDLGIDILTPHYGHYYQPSEPPHDAGQPSEPPHDAVQPSEPPHDAGQPVPNPFLVVAPEARFTFHITCAEHRLSETLQGDTWRQLIHAAFRHAFEWGGFGAKTAVGYGAMATAGEKGTSAAQASARIRKGDRVADTTGETGIVIAIKGDVAIVDFEGIEDEVPLSDLRRV